MGQLFGGVISSVYDTDRRPPLNPVTSVSSTAYDTDRRPPLNPVPSSAYDTDRRPPLNPVPSSAYDTHRRPPLNPVTSSAYDTHRRPPLNPVPSSAYGTDRSPKFDENASRIIKTEDRTDYGYQSDMKSLTQYMLETQMKATLPQREIKPYDGDPLNYCSFMQALIYGVEAKTSSNIDRLYYLDQLTTGEPNHIVKGLLNRGERGYIDAKDLLAKRFGNRYVIAEAYKKKAESWPDVKREEAKSWTSFSIFLTEYQTTMRDLNCLHEIDHSGTVKTLLSKLPYSVRNQWRIHVDNLEVQENKMAGLQEFVQCVERQARILANPLYGDINGEKGRNQPVSQKAARMRRSSFATNVKSDNLATNVKGENGEKINSATKVKGENGEKTSSKWCLHCKTSTHTLDVCRAV